MNVLKYILLLVFLFNLCNLIAQDNQSTEGLSTDEQLLVASDKGDSAAVQKLIQMGANVNAVTFEGVTPLMFAAQNGKTGIVNVLIQHGAKPDLKSLAGYSALLLAIYNNYIETTEYLIRNGANINQPDNNQVTPLMHAVMIDSFYLPDLLLYYGADADLRDKSGKNALMLASQINRYEIAVKLMETGVDVNATDNEGNTSLHYATAAGNTDLMELLIVNGAMVDPENNSGYTPFSIAVAKNDYDAARMLLGYGADVNFRINTSVNPLMLAQGNKNDSMARMLINQGAKPIQRPNFNQLTFGSAWTFNQDDTHLGFILGMSDNRWHLMPSLEYAFRPKAIRILRAADSIASYQYWERRHFISVSVNKAFLVHSYKSGFSTGAFAGISEVLTFGSYKGSEKKPEVRLAFNPRIGCMWDYRWLRMKLSYQLLDLDLKSYSKGWFQVSLELLINRKSSRIMFP